MPCSLGSRQTCISDLTKTGNGSFGCGDICWTPWWFRYLLWSSSRATCQRCFIRCLFGLGPRSLLAFLSPAIKTSSISRKWAAQTHKPTSRLLSSSRRQRAIFSCGSMKIYGEWLEEVGLILCPDFWSQTTVSFVSRGLGELPKDITMGLSTGLEGCLLIPANNSKSSNNTIGRMNEWENLWGLHSIRRAGFKY